MNKLIGKMGQCGGLWALLALSSTAMAGAELSQGQSLYLPIYSHLWYGERVPQDADPQRVLLSSLVSIRNISEKSAIRLLSARYYDTHGKLLREYVKAPLKIGALGTYEIFIEKKDTAGGSGANFVLEWDSEQPTNPPLVEAVHANIQGSQTVVFTTMAHEIAQEGEAPAAAAKAGGQE